LHAPADSSMMRQEFHLTGRADRWLPAAYEPVQLEGGDNPLVVKASSTLVSNRSDVSDLTYSVSSRQPPETLTGAQIDGTNAPLPAEMRGYTRLPSDFPSDVRDTAAAITAGATNPYDRARARDGRAADERVSRIRTDHGGLHPGAARHGAGRHQRAGDWPRQGRLHLRLEDRPGADRGRTGGRHGCRRHDRVRKASASAPPSR